MKAGYGFDGILDIRKKIPSTRNKVQQESLNSKMQEKPCPVHLFLLLFLHELEWDKAEVGNAIAE